MTSDNLHTILFEIEQVISTVCNDTRRQIEVGFLSPLFEEFVHLGTQIASESLTQQSNQLEAKFVSLQRVLKLVAYQSDFTRVICSSLKSALVTEDNESNEKLLLILLHIFLSSSDSGCIKTQYIGQHSFVLDSCSGLIFAVAIYSEGKFLDLTKKSNSILFARQYFTHLLLEEKNLYLLTTPTLRQVVLCSVLLSEVSEPAS